MSSAEPVFDDLSNNLLVTDWDVLIIGDDERPALAPVYRMLERDRVSGPKATLKEGDSITFSRIVVRVGYEIGVHSVTRKEWFEAGAKIIAERTGEPVETIKKVIIELGLSSPFKGIKHSIYDAIVRPLIMQTQIENRNVRAMWFYDYAKPRKGEILGVVTRMTGQRDPGGPSGEGDYDPPCLVYSKPQRLYKVRDYENDGMHNDSLVYPADAG